MELTALTNGLFTDVLFVLGVMWLLGGVMGALAGQLRLPEITGFVMVGVVIGESGFGLVPRELTITLRFITEMALGIIALTLGSEFAFTKLRRMGMAVAMIAVGQLLFTFMLVWPVMWWAGLELPFALMIAAVATASSPAVIVAIVQEMHVRGPLVDCLYGVLALLDAGAVILFGLVFALSAGLLGLTGGSGPLSLGWQAISEVFFSLLLGGVLGASLHLALRNKERANEILLVVFGFLFITMALATAFHLSTLLVMMTIGAVLINMTPRHHRVFRTLEPVTPPLYALFFVLAGCELQLQLLRQPVVLGLGTAYLVMRTIGKVAGTYAGAKLARMGSAFRRQLGWCMLPQAGVSLGLVLMIQASPVAASMTPAQADRAILLANIVLLAVFFNQLIGPPLVSHALRRGLEEETSEWI